MKICYAKMSMMSFLFFLMIRRPPKSKHSISSAASDVYKRQGMRDVLLLEREWLGSQATGQSGACLLYTSPRPRDRTRCRMTSSA